MRSTKLLLSLALLIPASALQARQLTPSQALDRAFSESGATPSRVLAADYSLSYTATAPGSSTPGVYVFNRPGGGFIMVSADDAAQALLGYSDTSTFSPEALSPSMVYWMESYASQVEWAAAHPSTPSRAAAERPSRAAIAPLLTTTWNQNAPYNDLCPEASGASATNGRCPTGCVATSTSQVMNYHKWPEKGTGSNSYELKIDNKTQTLSKDFSTVTFAWNNMLDSYAGSYNEAQGSAVATLMNTVGIAVDMQYGPQDSGTTSVKAWQALFTYFGYSKSARFSQRAWYGLYDWEDLIYNSLKNDGPAILGGDSSTGGHSFVCDGYSQDGFFHINWGWGGTSNGYFLLTALNPETQGIGGSSGGYNFNQDVITGIRPYNGVNAVCYQLVAEDLNPSSNNPRQITLSNIGVLSYSAAELNNVVPGIEIAGQYYYSNTKIPQFAYKPGSGYSFSYTVSLEGLPAGTYQARPAYKCDEVPAGAVMLTDVTSEPYITIAIANNGTVTPYVPAQDVSVDNFQYTTSFLAGQQFSFTADITNSGVTEYARAVSAVIIPQGSEQATIISEYAVDLMPGASTTATFTGSISSSLDAGTYTLYIANITDNGGVETLSEPQTITITKGTTPVIGLTSFSIANSSSVNPDAIEVTYLLTNTGGTFIGNLQFAIFAQGQTSTSNILKTPIIEVPANTTVAKEFKVTLKFPAAEPGATYSLVPYVGNNQLAYGQSFTIAAASGIDSVVADGTSNVTAIYTVAGQLVPTLDASTLAPGLYIFVTPEGSYKHLVR